MLSLPIKSFYIAVILSAAFVECIGMKLLIIINATILIDLNMIFYSIFVGKFHVVTIFVREHVIMVIAEGVIWRLKSSPPVHVAPTR